MKRFLTIFVVAATIAWSLGLAGLAPQASAAYSPADGDIIKTASNPAVYYISGGKRYLFSNRVTYGSWYADFSTLKVISQADFDAIPSGGNVTVRPGVNLIKFDNGSTVYAVAPGNKICKITSADAAKALYGNDWSKLVVTIQVAFESNYTVDPTCELTATSKYPAGTLIKASGSSDVYYWDGTNRRLVSSEAFIANGFKSSLVRTVADVTAYGNLGAALTAKEASIANPASGTTSTTPVTGGSLSVALAADTPAAGTLVAGQATADLAKFVISNNGSSDVKVNKIVLARIGVSADDTLSNVYLFKGAQRLTDAASVSSGNIIFTEYSSGIVTVPANSSVTITVKSDIASGSSGQTVGVKMVSINDTSFSGSGNLMSIATANLAAATTTASSPVSPTTDPMNEFLVWGNDILIGTREVNFNRLALRMVGSINYSDISNFKLYIDGNLVATASSLDNNGYVTFVPTSDYVLRTGPRNFKVYADITGGAGRTFQFSLRGAYDIGLFDSSYKVGINLGYSSAGQWTCQQVTVNSVQNSEVTVEKASDSPSSDVVKGGSDVLLAKYYLTTYGEAVKIDTLAFKATSSNISVGSLRNARLVLNGNQIGSTATLANTTAGTSFTVNTTLSANTKYTLEVRADIYDNNGTDDITDGDTLLVTMIQGSNNAQGKTSGELANVPSSNKPASPVTVRQGNVSIAKLSSYGTQTITVPQTAYKIGAFVVSGNSSEAVNLNNISIDFDGLSVTNLNDVYLKYNGKESTRKSSVSSSSNSWSINETIPVNGSMTLEVYASISSLASGTLYSTTTISGTTAVSGQTATSSAVGQIITVGSGSFSVSSASGVDNKLVVAGATEDVASFEFKAINDTYTLQSITVTTTDATSALGIAEVIVKDGSTEIARTLWAGTSREVNFNNPITILPGASNAKVLTVALKMASVNSDNAGQNVKIALTGYRVNSGSTGTYTTTTSVVGKDVYIFRSKPTVSINAGDTVLTAGTKQLARVTIAADAAGQIAFKQLVFNIATSGSYTLSNLALKDNSNTTIGTTSYSAGKATTTLTTEEKISTTKTYTLWGDISGTINSGDSIAVSIAAPSTAVTTSSASSFVWSDISNDNHTLTTSDWWSDYLVKNLPTASVALTK